MRHEASKLLTEAELDEAERNARSAATELSTGASALMVNRTHRVIRERAGQMRTQRSKVRSLWIPLGVSFSLLVVLVCALWTAFEEYEASPAGLPDTSQMLVLLMWSVPISVMLLAVVWFRRAGAGNGSGGVENERAR